MLGARIVSYLNVDIAVQGIIYAIRRKVACKLIYLRELFYSHINFSNVNRCYHRSFKDGKNEKYKVEASLSFSRYRVPMILRESLFMISGKRCIGMRQKMSQSMIVHHHYDFRLTIPCFIGLD